MSTLPPGFADLQPFAEQWCLATEPERYEMRLATPMPDIQAFYDAVAPRAEAAMAYCDQFPYPDLPDDARDSLASAVLDDHGLLSRRGVGPATGA